MKVLRIATFLMAAFPVAAQVSTESLQRYAQQVFFDNSPSEKSYYFSHGRSVLPSQLELVSNHIPLETSDFTSAPNSLRLRWQSKENGAWTMELKPAEWANREIAFPGHILSFWVYSKDGIRGDLLPQMLLQDAMDGFTAPIRMEAILPHLAAGHWTRVSVPIARFQSRSMRAFDPGHVAAIVFAQGKEDGAEHTMLIDDIRIDDAAVMHKPAVPAHLAAKAYEQHVDLTWDELADPATTEIVIYRALRGESFKQVGVQRAGTQRFADYIGEADADVQYRITARNALHVESLPSSIISAHTHILTDEEFLDMVQEASFHFYWDGAEPNSGMARESLPGNGDIIATGGSGFGIMTMVVAADRHYAAREEIVARLLRITSYLEHADRFHGVWPHFLSGKTGHVLQVFGSYDDGADLVETSFLMQGLLAARGYFTADTPSEKLLRDRITRLWETVEWDWFVATPNKDALYWHWSPEFHFEIANRLEGYNESLITYMLAIASPTHAAPASIYYSGYEAEGHPEHLFPRRANYYGIPVQASYTAVSTGPLFFTHYNFFGLDPRFRDKNVDWFENSRNITLIQQKYALENPNRSKGFGADAWGFSAVTGPHGYREFSPGAKEDDGTLAPTATGGAYAYTPDQSLLALKHFYRDLGRHTWDIYGFRNAFNQQLDWYAPDELALNQAPQAIMIENGRTGLLWRSFMANPEITKAQLAIGLKTYTNKEVKPRP